MSLSIAAPIRPAILASAGRSRAAFLAVLAAALVAGFLATGAQEQAQAIHHAGPALTRLLRGMAVLKGLMLAAAVAATLWRLGTPAAPARFALYTLAGGAMALGPGLVWGMVHLYVGSAAMNGGLFALIVLLWRDPAVGEMLAAEVGRRRARPKTGN